MKTILIATTVIPLGLMPLGCASYVNMYKRTGGGVIEVKTIPASKVLLTETEGRYFDRANDLFMRLFRYIDEKKVSMTVPVEAHMEKAGMLFFVGPDADKKDLPDTENVKVVALPERMVVSIGVTGSYSEANFLEAQNRLRTWLQQHAEYRAVGPAYAVYWNGPFTPWFMKRSEVHVPIAPAGA